MDPHGPARVHASACCIHAFTKHAVVTHKYIIHTYVHAYIYTYIHIYIVTKRATVSHKYIMHIHTYIHTYIPGGDDAVLSASSPMAAGLRVLNRAIRDWGCASSGCAASSSAAAAASSPFSRSFRRASLYVLRCWLYCLFVFCVHMCVCTKYDRSLVSMLFYSCACVIEFSNMIYIYIHTYTYIHTDKMLMKPELHAYKLIHTYVPNRADELYPNRAD
jgi:hypothetical protein